MAPAGIDRRKLLASGALIGVAGATAGVADTPTLAPRTTLLGGAAPWREGAADNPAQASGTGYRFFDPDEAAFVEAAVARLIPADHNGPGALETGVPLFIDRQLGGPFGHGDHFYLGGPWAKGSDTQGYQNRMTPAQLYRAGVRAANAWTRSQFGGKALRDLVLQDQDTTLKSMESGHAQFDGVESKTFFAMLLQNTMEGFFADPIYGGNKDMASWKMIGFPGARYDYREWVGRHGQRFDFPPVGIGGRSAWSEV